MKQAQQPGFISLSSSLGITIIAATFLIGILGSTFLDAHLPPKLSNFKKGYARGYENGVIVTKNRVEKSNLGAFFQTPSDVRVLYGKVTSVANNQLTLHVTSNNPFDSSIIADRIVKVDATTKIAQQVSKDPAVYKKELAAYTQKIKDKVAATVPFPYVEKVVPFSTIKVGDTISVIASSNIKTAKEFTASQVNMSVKMFTK
jgi:hypothetical protein